MLQSPYFWTPTKICDFLRKSHKLLTDLTRVKYKEKKTEAEEIIKCIDKEAREKLILGDCGNWKTVLDETDTNHYEVLIKVYLKGNQGSTPKTPPDTTALSEWLRCFRHKHEHGSEISANDRELVSCWFSTKPEPDDLLYAQFWIERFPKVLLFVWKKFYYLYQKKVVNGLEEYYSKLNNRTNIGVDPDSRNFPAILLAALNANLENGGLVNRYEARGDVDACLELRVLPVLDKILNFNLCRKIMTFSWSINDENALKYNALNVASPAITLLVIPESDRSTPENNNLIENLISNTLMKLVMNTRLIITTSGNRKSGEIWFRELVKILKDKTGIRFSVNPVNWGDLSSSIQCGLLNNAVKFAENDCISLKEILPKRNTRNSILESLQDNLLNRLLRKKKVAILQNCVLPKISEVYKERKVYNCSILNATIFPDTGTSHYFLVEATESAVDQCRKKVTLSKPCQTPLVKVIDRFCENLRRTFPLCRTFIIKRRIENVAAALHELSGPRNMEGAHCLRYLEKTAQFQWLGSIGAIPESFAKAVRKPENMEMAMDEADFIERVTSENTGGKVVFIADMPGMGKSMMLQSLASKLAKLFSKNIVILVEMNTFVEKVGVKCANKPTQNDVLNGILDCCCVSVFERLLVWGRLQEPEINFEIFLDGLDEVKLDLINVAFKIVKILETEIPSVRTWVTLRDHMLLDTATKFGNLGYKMNFFSRELQIDYLQSYWKVYCKKRGVLVDSELETQLEIYAGKCLNLHLSVEDSKVTGIPLHCRMIAEINEENVIARKFDREVNHHKSRSLIELYQQMVERKFQVFIVEKNKLPLDMSSHIANLIRNDMESCHIAQAIHLIISEDLGKKAYLLLKGAHDNAEDDAKREKAILEQGIIQQITPPVFIHRTFAEYFLALFIFKVLSGKFGNRITEADSVFNKVLNSVMVSVDETREQLPEHNVYKMDFVQPVVCHFLNAMWEGIGNTVSLELDNLLKMTDVDVRSASEHALASSTTTRIGYFYALLARYPNRLAEFFALALVQHQYKFCKYIMDNYEPRNWHRDQGFGNDENGMFHLLIRGFWPNLESSEQRKSGMYFFKQVLKRFPEELERTDRQGRTPVKFLLEYISIENRENTACPHYGKTGVLLCFLKFFRKNGANFLVTNDEKQNSMVQKAIELGTSETVIRALEKCGVNLEYQNALKQTALHLAVKMGSLPIVRVLVEEFKVNLKVKDNNGKTAYDYHTSDIVRNYINAPEPRIWLEICRYENMSQACWVYNDLQQRLLRGNPEKCYYLKTKNVKERKIELWHISEQDYLLNKILDRRVFVEITVSSLKTYAIVYFQWPSKEEMKPFVTKETQSVAIFVARDFSGICIKAFLQSCFESKYATLHIITSTKIEESDRRKLQVISDAYVAYYGD